PQCYGRNPAMEEAAKRYARWVLAVHLLLLVGVLVLVFAAARETYQRAREQVLNQLQDRQELLGSQTAQAVQDHYNAILANLQLIRRAEEREAAADSGPDAAPAARGLPAMRTARVLWRQLD